MSLAASDEKLLVVTSSLEAGVRAVRLGIYAQGIIQIHNAHNGNKNILKYLYVKYSLLQKFIHFYYS